MKKRILSVLLLVVFAAFSVVLVSCSGNKIKIGVVLPDASEERWANQDGRFFEDELEELGEGYEYDILFSEGDESKEVQNVEALIARGAEVIILTAEGSGSGASQVCHDEGVTLIAHDRMAKKDATIHADYYTTFNSWNVGKAMGEHLVDMAIAEGYSSTNKADLAIFAGRVADWPNATYFFGGAFEEIQPHLDMFRIVNQNPAPFEGLALYTEATFNDAAKTALQAAMTAIDTDWDPAVAQTKAAALVTHIEANVTDRSDDIFVLAPNDDTSAAIRQEFALMGTPYTAYWTTGQDASDVTLASLMGDPIKGKGTQTMTVFKDTSKLCADSVAIAKNIVDGVDGLTGLTSGPSIDGADTAYSPIDVLTYDDPQNTYDLIFATGYKDETSSTFSNINFAPYK